MARKTITAAANTVRKTPNPHPANNIGHTLRRRRGKRCSGGGRLLLGLRSYSYSSRSRFGRGRYSCGLRLPLSISSIGCPQPRFPAWYAVNLCRRILVSVVRLRYGHGSFSSVQVGGSIGLRIVHTTAFLSINTHCRLFLTIYCII